MTYKINIYNDGELVKEFETEHGLEVTSDLGKRIDFPTGYFDLEFDRIELEVV